MEKGVKKTVPAINSALSTGEASPAGRHSHTHARATGERESSVYISYPLPTALNTKSMPRNLPDDP